MSPKYTYLRDEDGNIIGRTFDNEGTGSQKGLPIKPLKEESASLSDASAKEKPTPFSDVIPKKESASSSDLFSEKESASLLSDASPKKERVSLSDVLPGDGQPPVYDQLLQQLKGGKLQALIQNSWETSKKGTAAVALALLLALSRLGSARTVVILGLLSSLLYLGTGVCLFLQKQAQIMWLCTLLAGLRLLEELVFIVQLALPYRVFSFMSLFICLLDVAAFLLLALLAKTRYGKGKSGFLWIVPTVLQVLRLVCSITLYSISQALFVYLAADLMTERCPPKDLL